MTEDPALLTRTLNVLDNGFNTHQLIERTKEKDKVHAMMKTASQVYYLVAREPSPFYYQDTKAMSIEKDLIHKAADDDVPILMACWWEKSDIPFFFSKDPGRPTWRLYDPSLIKANLLGEVVIRKGVILDIFEYHLGKVISDPMYIPGSWYGMKSKRSEDDG